MRSGARAMALFGLAALLAGPAGAQTTSNPPADAPASTEAPASPVGAGQPGPVPAPAPATQAPQPAPPDQFRSKNGDLRIATLIGATVVNDQKQTIGTISDVLLDKDAKAANAVLSVGGFLGVGSRLVAIPFADLHVEATRIVLPGATKVSLENLSAYQAGG